MLALYVWSLISYPGEVDSLESYDNYKKWEDTTQSKIHKYNGSIWLTLNIASTFFTIFAIKKLF